ncbi:MAG: DUF4386 domain-containing protein [Anaerolineales bacterium]|jgi:hypothetical protein|nr:MAG: DUF4386 domain-containing protein [Anaerolineales bacterium]
MNSNRRTARIVGALFLIAIVVSILGGSIIEPIITAPDYLSRVSANGALVVLGVLLELINGLAVIGIAVLLFPIFKKHNEALALGYVALRILEAVVVITALSGPLTLIALSREYVAAGAADASAFHAVGTSLVAERSLWVSQMLGIFFGLTALVLYCILYQSKLVPRFISIWGLIGAALVMAWNLLELFGISVSLGMVLALPMILNEIFLAIWLIVKGFNSPSLASESA